MVGSAILVLTVACAVWGQLAPPYDPLFQNVLDRLQVPSERYLLGTDQFGRDILSRLLVGVAPTLTVASAATCITCLLGIPVGAVCGTRSVLGALLSRFLDGVQAFPGLLLTLLLVAMAGASYEAVIFSIGLGFFPLVARVMQAVVESEANKDYVMAAISLGARPPRIFFRHVLPNGVSTLIVQATTVFALAILSEASLSFLGLGPSTLNPTWGRMIFDARATMELAPHTVLSPLAALSVLVIGVNLLGDGLRDRLDPLVTPQRGA